MAEPAGDSPQIVISYHADEQKWRDRLVTHLDLAVDKFSVVDDRQTSGVEVVLLLEELRERFRAKVVVFHEVVTYGPRVSRFSFRVSRAEAAQ